MHSLSRGRCRIYSGQTIQSLHQPVTDLRLPWLLMLDVHAIRTHRPFCRQSFSFSLRVSSRSLMTRPEDRNAVTSFGPTSLQASPRTAAHAADFSFQQRHTQCPARHNAADPFEESDSAVKVRIELNSLRPRLVVLVPCCCGILNTLSPENCSLRHLPLSSRLVHTHNPGHNPHPSKQDLESRGVPLCLL